VMAELARSDRASLDVAFALDKNPRR